MRLVSFLAALVLAAPAWAQDEARGRQVYELHCQGCHYERLHQRDRSRWQAGRRRRAFWPRLSSFFLSSTRPFFLSTASPP